MVISFPVRGLRPCRALRRRTSKLPKPLICTLLPLRSSLAISPPDEKNRSTSSAAFAFEHSSRLATVATRPCLFTHAPRVDAVRWAVGGGEYARRWRITARLDSACLTARGSRLNLSRPRTEILAMYHGARPGWIEVIAG